MAPARPGPSGDRKTAFGLGLACAYYFLLKSVVNVLFVTGQTVFFTAAGVWALPYVYTAMNLLYIGTQGALLSRLAARSACYLTRLSWVFAGAVVVRLAVPGAEHPVAVTAFLLAVMVFDLFFNQFFTHYLNDVFPLQEGKRRLPVITAAGSLAFIASGMLLQLALAFAGLRTLMAGALVGLLAAQVVLWATRRSLGDGAADPPEFPPPQPSPGGEGSPPTPPGSANAASAGEAAGGSPEPLSLGRLLAVAGFFTMLGKYWLDYQYSRAITQAFPSEQSLASFIALYTSGTDFLVFLSQMGLAAAVLGRLGLARSLLVMPAAVLGLGLVTAAGAWPLAVLVTQFAFTYLVKTLHGPASSLLLPVLPAAERLRVMGLTGMASSAGCLLVGLALIVVQSGLTTRIAFGVHCLVFGALLAVVWKLAAAHRTALARGLRSGPEAAGAEALESLRWVEPADRTAYLARLLQAGQPLCDRALEAVAELEAEERDRLLEPLVTGRGEPCLAASAARVMAAGAGDAGRARLLGLLESEAAEARVRANILESWPAMSDGVAVTRVALPLVGSANPRVAAAAALAVTRSTSEPASLETALTRLSEMLDDRTQPPSRQAALAALGATRDEAFLPALAASLSDPEEAVVRSALAALGRYDHPAVMQPSRDYLARQPPPPAELGQMARQLLERIELRTMRGLGQLLDRLTDAERAQALERLGQSPSDRKVGLFRRALALSEPAPRQALCGFLARCDEPGWAALLEAALEGDTAGRVTFRPASLAPPAPTASPADWGPLARLLDELAGAGAGKERAQLLLQAVGRLWLERACLDLEREHGGAPEWVRLAAARLARRIEVACDGAASGAAHPGRARAAVERLRSADRFAASLAVEYLQPELGLELTGRLAGLLDVSTGAAEQAGVVARSLGFDVRSLQSEQRRRCLGGE